MPGSLAKAALAVTMILSVMALLPAAAEAKPAASGARAATTLKGNLDCEREKVQVCHWEGDRHVCVWVDGPCAVF